MLQSEVLAASNERASELKATIKGQQPVQRRADRRWLFGKGNYVPETRSTIIPSSEYPTFE